MIRQATKKDAEAIFNIEQTMFNESVYFKLSLREIKRLLNKPSTYFYIFCNNENIAVGYALGIIINKKAIWFNSLAVLKEYQNTFAAKLLFDKIESSCNNMNLSTVILEIRKDNKALLRRYSSIGYKIWKEIEAYYPDRCGAYRLTKCIK